MTRILCIALAAALAGCTANGYLSLDLPARGLTALSCAASVGLKVSDLAAAREDAAARRRVAERLAEGKVGVSPACAEMLENARLDIEAINARLKEKRNGSEASE